MPELLDRLKQALADRYAIERELGAGGMATVPLGTDLIHQRQVAIKVAKPESCRCARLRAAPQLVHPPDSHAVGKPPLRIARIAFLLLPMFGAAACDREQGNEWQMLNKELMLLQQEGQYSRAVVIAEKALDVAEKTGGPDHPYVAGSLNSLGGLYETQGQYAQAERLYQRSLAILEKALGPDHPDVAQGLNNLAALYDTQGQYAQAEPLHQRSLAILEKALGPDHPYVAKSLNNLASLYVDQGRYVQAEPFYQRSLAILEKALGPDHPDVVASFERLAVFYRKTGRAKDAEQVESRAARIRAIKR